MIPQTEALKRFNVPTLSIGIPCYNEQGGIERAIRSCFIGNPDAEVVVSNNASTDGTPEILSKLCVEFPGLKVFHQSKKISLQDNYQFVLNEMTAEFAIFLPAHHFQLPGSIAKMIERMENDSSLALCFGGIVWRNLKGNYFLRLPPYIPGRQVKKDFFIKSLHSWPDAVATLYRTKQIQKHGFHPKFGRIGFLELLLRAILEGDAWYVPYPVMCWIEYPFDSDKLKLMKAELPLLDEVAFPYAEDLGISRQQYDDLLHQRNISLFSDTVRSGTISQRFKHFLRKRAPGWVYLSWHSFKLWQSPFLLGQSIRQAKRYF